MFSSCSIVSVYAAIIDWQLSSVAWNSMLLTAGSLALYIIIYLFVLVAMKMLSKGGVRSYLLLNGLRLYRYEYTFVVLFLTVIFAPFPSGLVIYWTVNNILTMAQQVVIMKQTKVKTT